MSASIIGLIIQLVAGAGGSSVLASAVSKFNLGPLANIITGALGGVGGGSLLGGLLQGGAASGLDLGSVITQLIGGGVGGPIVTIIVALIRNAMSGQNPA
jgi:hypothetical protein